MLPAADRLTICFAHVAYRLHERFSGTRYRHRQLRRPRSGDFGEASGRSRCAGDLRPVAERPPRSGEEALLHTVDRRRHRPVPARRAGEARHPPRQRARRQRPGGCGACDGVHPGIEPPASRSSRQPGKTGLARHDRRPRPGGKTSSAARRCLSSDWGRSADASPSSPKPSICASSDCGAIRATAVVLRMPCTRSANSRVCSPRPISSR